MNSIGLCCKNSSLIRTQDMNTGKREEIKSGYCSMGGREVEALPNFQVLKTQVDVSDSQKHSFKVGDLVYGLNESRNDYYYSNEYFSAASMGDGKGQHRKVWTIDQYQVSQLIIKSREENGFKLPCDNSDFVKFLIEHPKYCRASDPEKRHGYLVQYHPDCIAWKCKGGLAWAATARKKVHFVLDGLNMKEVVNKSNVKDRQPFMKAYTGSELRWLYRHRFDAPIMNNVVFWYDGKVIDPPWTTAFQKTTKANYDVIELWDSYRKPGSGLDS